MISDVSTVWVQAHLYDRDLREVHAGDSADVRVQGYADVFHGEVTSVGHLVDPATRTTLVRIVTANTTSLLRKDQFVDVTIHGRAERTVLVVPTTSVLYDEQNLPFVYLEVGDGKYAQRLVNLGTQQGPDVEVTSGVKAGDRVVGQGALFLQFANTIGK
jgi:cobalt-zinc-cadmium efflux system membrane fusion protein